MNTNGVHVTHPQQRQGAYDYTMQPAVNAMSPYSQNPYSYNLSHDAFALLRAQLEYYFSVDNLCKDLYLRSHMDSQGFVPLAFVARFNRLQEITTSDEALGNACEDSNVIDIVLAQDGSNAELVRSSCDWRPFVLPIEERKPAAQNDGPSELVYRSRLAQVQHWYHAQMMGYMHNGQNGHMQLGAMPGNTDNGGVHRMNPVAANGYAVFAHGNSISDSSLSGAVSSAEFTPTSPMVDDGMQNGHGDDEAANGMNQVSRDNEAVENLNKSQTVVTEQAVPIGVTNGSPAQGQTSPLLSKAPTMMTTDSAVTATEPASTAVAV